MIAFLPLIKINIANPDPLPLCRLNFIDPVREWQPFTREIFDCPQQKLKKLKYMFDGRHFRIKYVDGKKEYETQINGFAGMSKEQRLPYLTNAIYQLENH